MVFTFSKSLNPPRTYWGLRTSPPAPGPCPGHPDVHYPPGGWAPPVRIGVGVLVPSLGPDPGPKYPCESQVAHPSPISKSAISGCHPPSASPCHPVADPERPAGPKPNPSPSGALQAIFGTQNDFPYNSLYGKNVETAQTDCNSQSVPTEPPPARAAKQRPRTAALYRPGALQTTSGRTFFAQQLLKFIQHNTETAQADGN